MNLDHVLGFAAGIVFCALIALAAAYARCCGL